MEFAYRPEEWQHMFEMVALAAVTLAGLLFVGLSINLRTIVGNPMHLARAREAMIALFVLLAISVFVLIPAQGPVALGIELMGLSLLVLIVSIRLQWGTVRQLPARRRRSWVTRLVGLNCTTLAIGFAGAGLVTGRLGGFLWLVPTILSCFVWSTLNAWNLAVRATDPTR